MIENIGSSFERNFLIANTIRVVINQLGKPDAQYNRLSC